MKKEDLQRLIPILLVVLLDMTGIGMVVPLLSPLFLETDLFLGADVAFAARALILGIVIASYPLAQFLGSPIFGALSDKYGRKKIMQVTLWGRAISYAIMAVGMILFNIEILLAGRIINGFTGGNISVAMSAVADFSTRKTKSANFGYVGMALALGLVLGPFMGGFLADPNIVSWFSYSTPFTISAVLSLANIVLLHYYFRETLMHLSKKTKVDLLMSFRNIAKAAASPTLRVMFLVIFLISFGYGFFTQFFQVLLIQKFSFGQGAISLSFAYVGFWIAVSQGFVNSRLSQWYSPGKILKVSLFLAGLGFIALIIPQSAIYMLLVLPIVAILMGVTIPNYNAVISNLVSDKVQGEILGITQSVQCLAYAIPPLIAGVVVSINMNLPMEIAAVSAILAWVIYRFKFYKSGQ